MDKIVKYILDNTDCSVRLITNGNYKDKSILCRLYKIGLRDIMFSLDGIKETHNYLRGDDEAYDNTVDSIKYAVDLGYDVRVNFVINKININELNIVTENAILWGAKIFSVFLMSPIGRGEGSYKYVLTAYEWKKKVQEYEEWYKHLKDTIPIVIEQGYLLKKELDPFDYDKIEGRGNGCRKIATRKDYLIVRADGKTFPCVFFINTEYDLGNIKNESILDIYNKEWSFYKSLERPYIEECKECKSFSICKAGCRGNAYFYMGDYFAKDIRCTEEYYPVCPILKYNLGTGKYNGSTEGVIK